MLSLREISERCGVSIATVSRALDPRFSSKVSASTRSRILSLCDRHNYRPSLTGRSFVTGLTFKVGIIFGSISTDLGNVLGGLFMRGVCFELQARNYAPLILHVSSCRDTELGIDDFLRSNVADAYIIGSAMVTDKIRDAIIHCKRPVLATNAESYDLPQLSSISRNIVSAYKQAWQQVPVSWRQRTLFAAGKNKNSDMKLKSICAAAPNQEKPRVLLWKPPFYDFAFDRHHAKLEARHHIELLASHKIIWCGSDLTALGIADALEEKGLLVGKDVFLIGHDNLEGVDNFVGTPFLSTIDTRWEEWGRLAGKAALQLVDSPTKKQYTLDCAYIARKSFPNTLRQTKGERNESH